MPKYNIIYKSPEHDHYLWDGIALEKIENADRETLMYSGKSLKNEDLESAIAKCKDAVKQFFPNDTDPDIKPVEVKISS